VQASLLYDKFLAYLKDKTKQQQQKQQSYTNNNYSSAELSNIIEASPDGDVFQRFFYEKNKFKAANTKEPWIETLLTIPLPEYRKYCVWRILSPYLINTQHLPFEIAYNKICQWLDRCNSLHPLNFQPESRVTPWLESVTRNGYYPISFDNPGKEPKTLKTEKPDLYELVKLKMLEDAEKSEVGGGGNL
jgi:hypothetical protein